jgi:hypothetical protein
VQAILGLRGLVGGWFGWRVAVSPVVVAALTLRGVYQTDLGRRTDGYRCRLDAWTVEDLGRCTEVVLNVFGLDRLMVRSDWPVCVLALSYRQGPGDSSHLTVHLASARAMVFATR